MDFLRPFKIFSHLGGALFSAFKWIWRRLLLFPFALLFDTIIAALSYPAALFLRLGYQFYDCDPLIVGQQTIGFGLIALGAFLWSESYKGIWRYISLADLARLLKTALVCQLLFVPLLLLTGGYEDFPHSALMIQFLLLGAMLCGTRLLYRIFFGGSRGTSEWEDKVKILLIGTGDRVELFLREISRQKRSKYEILGIISPAGMYVSRQIHGVNVLGTLEDIEEILGKLSARKQPPDYLIIADQIFQGQKLFEFLALVERLGLRVGQLPNTTELISPLEKMRIRSLSVEDLLGRPQTTLDLHSMFSLLKGKRVLITGVGGSIGRELMRQIAEFSPAHMVLLDHSEMLLYQAASDLQEKHPYLSHRLLMIDVREKERIQQVMAEEKPEFVFHAAALKHVPLVESHPVEGVFTNLLGTRYIADACIANKVSVMVLISTDKAIRPTSIMGMTKRLAEAYCQSVDVMDQGRKSHGTHFTTVRFGNVLGSTGSVVPLFRRQIERGGPVTVTHPKMMRYFMSVQEAVQLLLQATVLGASSIIKRGRVFVLDMGDPLSILELAENMIRLSDLRPYEDIKIEFTGLRPGEKLYEELFDENEEMLKTDNPAILTASPQFSNHKILSEALDKLEIAVAEHDQQACVDLLRSLLPDSERESAQDQQEKVFLRPA